MQGHWVVLHDVVHFLNLLEVFYQFELNWEFIVLPFQILEVAPKIVQSLPVGLHILVKIYVAGSLHEDPEPEPVLGQVLLLDGEPMVSELGPVKHLDHSVAQVHDSKIVDNHLDVDILIHIGERRLVQNNPLVEHLQLF